MMPLEFRCGPWDVYNAIMDRYHEIDEKLRDPSLSEEERKYYLQLQKENHEKREQQLQEIRKRLLDGSLSPIIPKEFLPPLHSEETEKRRLERYKKNDPEKNYDFSESVKLQNIKKRLLDYFNREGFSI